MWRLSASDIARAALWTSFGLLILAPASTAHARIASSVVAGDSKWPWRDICRSLNEVPNACVVKLRIDLPTLDNSTVYEISYIRKGLDGLGSARNLSLALGLMHSGLLIQKEPNTDEDGETLILEYTAIHGGLDPFMPGFKTEDATEMPHWEKAESVLKWTTVLDKEKWDQDSEKVGTATGKQLNEWFMWIPKWVADHMIYDLWSVSRNAANPSQELIYHDSICHTWSQDGLVALYERGASLTGTGMRRNYFPLLSNDAAPEQVKMDDPEALAKVSAFYRDFVKIVPSAAEGNITAFQASMSDFFEKHGNRFYVRKHGIFDSYQSIQLAAPYFAAAKYWSEQPMVVPWDTTGPSTATSPTSTTVTTITTTTLTENLATTTTAGTPAHVNDDKKKMQILIIVALAVIIGLGLVFCGLMYMLIGDRADEPIEATRGTELASSRGAYVPPRV